MITQMRTYRTVAKTLTTSGLRAVLLAWAVCAVGQAEVHIATVTELFPVPDMKDAARLVEIVGGTSVRPHWAHGKPALSEPTRKPLEVYSRHESAHCWVYRRRISTAPKG